MTDVEKLDPKEPMSHRDLLDKARWGDGPWQKEPDRVAWVDSASGLPCELIRNPYQGHWCGYIALPRTHPKFGYDVTHFQGYEVHDGVTFANHQLPIEMFNYASRPIAARRLVDVFWVGFSCGMGGVDYMPALNALLEAPQPLGEQVYRDLDYATAQVERLAAQLQARKR